MQDEIFDLICKEKKRQADTLMMVASENYVSQNVLKALGGCLTNKYSEGYPGKRYYQGNRYIDEIEQLAINRANQLFGTVHANVQPHSGCEANLAIIAAICDPGDSILSQHLNMGGHLSHGQEASFTSKIVTPSYYGLTENGNINWQELKEKASIVKPKIIFCGGTGFTKLFDFEMFGEIADRVGAYFVADISHIAGLVVGGIHPSPVNYAHIIMTTTHKTLRGPRGAMILVTKKGLEKDSDLPKKINKAVFPGLQGGPHNNNIAAIAVALKEAGTAAFKSYASQIVINTKTMANELIKSGYELVGRTSENHMIWIDLRNQEVDGWTAAWGLETAGIITNRQPIPNEPGSPYYPSGLRLGTPAITTRGMGEKEMVVIAGWFKQTIRNVQEIVKEGKYGGIDGAINKDGRHRLKLELLSNKSLLQIGEEVNNLCQDYSIYPF